MAGKAIMNYTTTIAVSKTVGEIVGMLVAAGASNVNINYCCQHPTGLEFSIGTKFGGRSFRLPANVRGVLVKLEEASNTGQIPRKFGSQEQAERTVWRILAQKAVFQFLVGVYPFLVVKKEKARAVLAFMAERYGWEWEN